MIGNTVSFWILVKSENREEHKHTDLFLPALSMTTLAKPLSIVAKCALCSTKTELFVCPHCDEVICQLCVNKHQSELNETLKEHWLQCKSKFQQLQESPDEATPPHSGADSCEEEVDHIRQTIEQRHLDFVRLIDKEKHALLVRLEDYLHVAGTRHADLQQSLQSLSQRFRNGLNPSYNPNDFLLEIEHLNAQMDYQERLMQADPLKVSVHTFAHSIIDVLS